MDDITTEQKKIRENGMFLILLALSWFYFWNGSNGSNAYFEPNSSNFYYFIFNTLGINEKTSNMITWLTAVASIPTSWFSRKLFIYNKK